MTVETNSPCIEQQNAEFAVRGCGIIWRSGASMPNEVLHPAGAGAVSTAHGMPMAEQFKEHILATAISTKAAGFGFSRQLWKCRSARRLGSMVEAGVHGVTVRILPVIDSPEQGYVYRIFAPQFGEKIVQRVQQGSLILGLREPDPAVTVATRKTQGIRT